MDVVGIKAKNRGGLCPQYDCCGNQVAHGMTLKATKEKMKYQGDDEDDILAVYLVSDGVVRCKVGFLANTWQQQERMITMD